MAPPTDSFQSLEAAVKSNDADAVERVLDEYPELKSQLDGPFPGGFGETPLLAAIHRRNRAMVDVLLRAGADINQRSHWWAGSFGVLDNESELHEYLIERGAHVDAYAAARHGTMDRLRAIVEADPSAVHMRGGDGQTPLHVAKSVEVASFLLEHGADIDALDVDHESTPAQYLVKDRPDVARYLIARGCHTDLLMAAVLGDLGLARKHLDSDPSSIRINVSNEWFTMRDTRAGGTIYIFTLGWHRTPHALARDFGHDDVFRLLMERSPDDLKLVRALEHGDDALARDLLARRPDLVAHMSAPDQRRLVDAAQDNNHEVVRRMLEAGWPVDVRGQHGGTALHWAGFHGNAQMVRDILERRPPLELHDHEYDATPLFWAAYGSKHGWCRDRGDYVGCVEALLKAGAALPEVEASDAVREYLRSVTRPRDS